MKESIEKSVQKSNNIPYNIQLTCSLFRCSKYTKKNIILIYKKENSTKKNGTILSYYEFYLVFAALIIIIPIRKKN